MKTVKLKIDGIAIEVPENYTILEAAKAANVWIPTLCFLKDINEIGACRICLVEIKGARALQASCVYPVAEGIEVMTNSAAVREARKVNLELILSNHNRDCLTCMRSRNCELQTLANEFNIKEIRFEGEKKKPNLDLKSDSITRDPSKCVLCRRCVSVCSNVQSVAAINTMNRGFNTSVEPIFNKSLADVACVNCGQCITACPVGALGTPDQTEKIWAAISDPDKYVIAQVAPAVRVAIGEEFGLPIGTRSTKNMVGSMLKLGFDKVFDTDTGADLTIMEEGTELINRIKNGGKLPLITSCSPGWIKFCEHFYPDFIENLSTCKSPHEMFGAMLKTYYAEKEGIDPKKIVVVSVMPCVAKKFEANRPEMEVNGLRDVDFVTTTRGIAKMIKEVGIEFEDVEGEFDNPMGEATGAAVIFGATGGVMEAALRTVSEILRGEKSAMIEYDLVRGSTEGIKEASIEAGGMKIKAAVVHGLANARVLLDKMRAGEVDYHFVEIMACPGGCVTGGGQPIQPSHVRSWENLSELRAGAIYEEDRNMAIRKSHENKVVQKMYEDFLGEPGGHKAHELLHTHYQAREKY